VTTPGNDPGTSRLVAQCLNHYATARPVLSCNRTTNIGNKITLSKFHAVLIPELRKGVYGNSDVKTL